MSEVSFDAVVLAGGQGSRLGGVDKAELKVGGVPLLDRALNACADASTVVVVGPVEAREGIIVTREDPPGTGPAAGICAGLEAIDSPAEWTLVLACDLPNSAAAVSQLMDALGEAEAYCLQRADDQRPDWLLGAYRSTALRRAAADYGDPRNRSVHRMLGPLEPVLVAPAEDYSDVDTWADHARWNKQLRAPGKPEDRSQWRPFIERACAGLGLDPAMVDEDVVLDMTREIAHSGARPMAPVSSWILGLAQGGGLDADHARRVIEDVASAAPIPEDAR